jgi:Ca2+-binding EF-hand superfamily protein
MQEMMAAQVDAAVGYNISMVMGLQQPLKSEYDNYKAELSELMVTLRSEVVSLETAMTVTEAAGNVLRASFGLSAVESSNYIRTTTQRIVAMATCEPLNAAYEAVRAPMCEGARRAIDTIFLASMIAAVALLPLLPIGLQTLKHARQRLRDARHPLVNVMMVFDWHHFRRTRYMREKELEKVTKILATGRAVGEGPGGAALGVPHAYPTYGEDLVYVEVGKGVDGWGHEPSHGVTPAHELEPPLFPGKAKKFDYLADHMIKGPSEAAGLHDSTVVSRLDKGNLYDGRDKRRLELDQRTGKLRWLEDESKKQNGPVSVEDAVLKLYSAIERQHGTLEESELPAMIMELFRKIDEDGSGAIAKPELKEALEELGMFPSNSEINRLMQAYDSSGEGLLDLPDFRSLIMSAMDLGKARSSAKAGKATEETARAAPMLSTAGRRHPATRRVEYDAKGAAQADSDEEEEEAAGEFFPDEAYIRQIFQDLDQDGNGTLDEAELRMFGETLGLGWDDNFAKDIMLAVDSDGGGSIDVEEFWGWYKRWSRHKQVSNLI